MRIDQRFLVDKDITIREEIECFGDFEFDPNKSATLFTSKNIIIRGKVFKMIPANASIVHRIRFIEVDENKFVGGGLEPIPSDVGLWFMGEGTMDIHGTPKTPWTFCNEVRKGAVSISCKDAAGWLVGDEFVIAQMDQPPPNIEGKFSIADWDDATNSVIDKYFDRSERRKIKSISGNNVFFDGPLKYDHLKVDDVLPPVGNLTRNVKIEGTPTGRAHVFSCSHGEPGTHHKQQHTIKYLEISHMGPRKGPGRPRLITGRYALHFHHGGTGTEGSIVEGCSIHDTGNRNFVPHLSHGITMKNNVSYNSLETAFWWDWQEITHRAKWLGNLVIASRQNGIDSKSISMLFGQGDDNEARDNVVVYGHTGDVASGAAYWWDADAEGVWIFENNIAIACQAGLGTWQNSVYVHIVKGYRALNCFIAMLHGAYANMYLYAKNKFFNAKVIAKASATAGNTGYELCEFNGNNQLNELVEVRPSPTPSQERPNVFRHCTFKNAKIGLLMNCGKENPDNDMKIVDVIGCDFINVGQQFAFGPGPLDSYFRVQDKNGKATKVTKSGTTNIGQFAPLSYGTGEGLTAKYYNGANFDSLVLTRIDPMVYYQQMRKDPPRYPLGVNALIKGDSTKNDPFSIVWTGKLEAQWSEPHIFRFTGGSGYRLFIDGKLIINSWVKKGENNLAVDSAAVALKAGQKYDIKIELTDNGATPLGIVFYWKSPSMSRFNEVPYSQLYSDGVIVPPVVVPPIETDPCKIFVEDDYKELNPDVAKEVGVGKQFKTGLEHYNQFGKREGRRINKLCKPVEPVVFINVEKKKDFIRNNCKAGEKGSTFIYVVPAGKFSGKTQLIADALAEADIMVYGQLEANKNGTCTPIVVPPKPGFKEFKDEAGDLYVLQEDGRLKPK